MKNIYIYVNARRKRMPKRERHKKQGKYPNYINIFVCVYVCVCLFFWLGDFLKSFFMLVCIHSDFDSIQSQFNSRHAIYNA